MWKAAYADKATASLTCVRQVGLYLLQALILEGG
jgi:hypothetical protein